MTQGNFAVEGPCVRCDDTQAGRTRSARASKSAGADAVRNIHTVSRAVELRDPYTVGHQRRVAGLSCSIAQIMGLDDNRTHGLRLGAMIHDIGKIGVPAEILSRPSKLSATEHQLVREHAVMGYNILKDIQFPWPIAEIAHQHHDRMDGSGYPNGLKCEEILLKARIVAVADVLESSISPSARYSSGDG